MRAFLIDVLRAEREVILEEVDELANPGQKERRRQEAETDLLARVTASAAELYQLRKEGARYIRPRRVCVTGPSGSGKITLCRRLQQRYHMVHVHVGQLVDQQV